MKVHIISVTSAVRLFLILACIICGLLWQLPLTGASIASYQGRPKQFYTDVNDDATVNVNSENTRPIVGVLAQEVSQFVLRNYPDQNYKSYIAASYVKFVEGAGGRVVPIWIGKERAYYEDILSKINGVLLPGGATYFNQSHGYADAGRHIYDIAIEMNDRGIYMPVWGTCLGFELLIYLSANSTDLRSYCSSSAQALPLEFKKGYKKSRLFSNASPEVLTILKTYNITPNFHIFCFTEETFAETKLNETWNVLSVNHDWENAEFISSVEHRRYPFYGVQFHPEKNLYEFIPNRNITHTSQAIVASQYFADFVVNEARKNGQSFLNRNEETEALIYNYAPVYTGAKGSAFVQQYLFKLPERTTADRRNAGHNAATPVLLRLCLTLIAVVAFSTLKRV